MPNINIRVANKIATNMSPAQRIVCGNSDFTITFTFDSEWQSQTQRTARFIYHKKGLVHHKEVAFTGATVSVPILSGVDYVMVGVYAGDLHTTTPARVNCDRSILCQESSEELTQAEKATLQAQIGNLAALLTGNKRNLVAAINEIVTTGGGGGGSGVVVTNVEINDQGNLIVTLSNGSTLDAGYCIGLPGEDGDDGTVVTIGENGNWYLDGVDTGVSASGSDGGSSYTLPIANAETLGGVKPVSRTVEMSQPVGVDENGLLFTAPGGGGGGGTGENGGYYMPVLTQNGTILTMTFVASKPEMTALPAVTIFLPEPAQGTTYTDIDCAGGNYTLLVETNTVYRVSDCATMTVQLSPGDLSAHLYVQFADTQEVGIVLPAGVSTYGSNPETVEPGDSWEISIDSVGGILSYRKVAVT